MIMIDRDVIGNFICVFIDFQRDLFLFNLVLDKFNLVIY